jgi:hypothetical protein
MVKFPPIITPLCRCKNAGANSGKKKGLTILQALILGGVCHQLISSSKKLQKWLSCILMSFNELQLKVYYWQKPVIDQTFCL